MPDYGDLKELPRQGKALIVTDLHGNLDDFNKIREIWKDLSSKDNHLILTGDFIHPMDGDDGSLDILDAVQADCEKYENNFHPLLGNHEWATILHISIYKGGINQTLKFEKLLKDKFGDAWRFKLDEYTNFFQKLPIAVKTDNEVFISHSGPSKGISSLNDLRNMTEKGYLDNIPLYELLWNRYGDYSAKDVDDFLKIVGCRAMIVGHTPVEGYKLIGNQLIVSSSFSRGKKAYVELDLEKDIENGHDLEKMVKYFQ
ncbi:metallophosphoesterase [Methanobacterium ferruginis]|uniref:metallophosphoesterase n=1 Tax=Methanobacterium ferruginis TaxID=710191 RepID=UPI002572F95B|nr:metallophosphoesterase [Methanobacterium ferruginis]BDZ68662.1 hypothetical protein GCM10025860_21100 [Methanobacterium ferruginis]